MTYFKQLREFIASYRVGLWGIIKLIALYPVFKVLFWHSNGRSWQKRFARLVFGLCPGNICITIRLYLPTLHAHVPVPVWLKPDRLTSFCEIFWGRAYRLNPNWIPTMLIDLGANAGYGSLYIAGHSNVRKILAVEANPDFQKPLERMVALLRKHGVEMRVAMGAVVGRPRQLIFAVMENDRDSSVVYERDSAAMRHTLTVKGQRISDWVRDTGFSETASQESILLKADVEGAEHEMLEEQPELMSSFDYLIMEVHGDQELRDKLVSRIIPQHQVLERQFNPAYPKVEVLLSEHSRLRGDTVQNPCTTGMP